MLKTESLKTRRGTSDVITWRRPASSYEHYWRTVGLPATKDFLRYWIKWSLLLGIPGAIAGICLAPEKGPPLVGMVVLLCGIPFALRKLMFLEPAIHKRWPTEYKLDQKGVTVNSGRISWKRVEGAAIEDHPDLPSLRRLTLKVHGLRFPQTVDFDPAELDESVLTETLSEHVHAKILLRPASGSAESDELLRPAATAETPEVAYLLRSTYDTPCRLPVEN